MLVYLARHGESRGNATGDYSTSHHDNVSKKGKTQARKLAKRISRISFDHIYCSPLQRAVQTIMPYAQKKNRHIEIWPELAESCWQKDRTIREYETPRYLPCETLSVKQERYFCFRDGARLMPSGNESYSEGMFRIRQAVQLLKDRHGNSDDSILIVSHGFTLSRLIEYMLGMEPEGCFDHANTGLSLIVPDAKEFSVRFVNRL